MGGHAVAHRSGAARTAAGGTVRSAIYTGTVQHERLRPKRHRLQYRVFSMLIDLDELTPLDGRFPLLGINRGGVFSFRESDHGDGVTPLRDWAADLLLEHGVAWDGGRIEMLCYPRILGFVFNPLTVYFCRDRSDRLVAILYEVHNTHGERHTYVLPGGAGERIVRHVAKKQFFVSPFMPMDCIYRFRIAPPGDRVGVSILEDDAEGLLLTASFAGKRVELSNGTLRRVLWSYPLMTLKVVAGIHWEAIKLLLKRVPMFGWQPAPARIAVSGKDVAALRAPVATEPADS
jgi:DUF1365 family protein